MEGGTNRVWGSFVKNSKQRETLHFHIQINHFTDSGMYNEW